MIHIRRQWSPLINAAFKCGAREFEPGKPRNKGARQSQFATCAECIAAEARDRVEKKTRRINLEPRT